ncbi:MAG: penicillin-binding Tp47 domain A-containing protein [Collinsella sp.]
MTKIADSTYEGTATANSNDPAAGGNEWDVDSYEVKVTVQVASHKITSVKVSDETYAALDGEAGLSRQSRKGNARKHVTGMADKIVEANGTSVDAVSTATVSSNAIKAAVDNALQAAYDEQNPSTPATDEYTYGYAGLTWAEYWAGENVQAAGSSASSSELDSRNEADKGAFDVVTRATFNHGLHRGSYQCTDVIETAEGVKIYPSHYPDSKSFVDVNGNVFSIDSKAKTVTAADGTVYTMTGHEVTGLKYVPVKIKTSDLRLLRRATALSPMARRSPAATAKITSTLTPAWLRPSKPAPTALKP